MQILSQQDPHWAYKNIGDTPFQIGRLGCTITSISMLSSWYGKWFAPDWMAKNLSFTKTALLYWMSINAKQELPLRFVRRFYNDNEEHIKELLFSANESCIAQVDNYHWVVILGYSRAFGFRIADPIDGKIRYLTTKYKKITGYTVFTRK